MKRSLQRRVARVAMFPAYLFGATLLIGGVAAWRVPDMRPPRLPDRRPPYWVLPTIGAGWLAATAALGRGYRLLLSLPGWALVSFETTRMLVAAHKTGPTDIVLILGCALAGDRPSDMLERRLRRAVTVVKRARGRAATPITIVCCGGVGADGEDGCAPPSEAEVMAGWLAEHGIRSGADGVRVIEERESTSTVENIANAIALLPPVAKDTRVTVVTSDFHVPRVKQTIRQHGFDQRLGTRRWHVEGAWTPHKYWATSTLREFLAQPVVWVTSAKRELRRLRFL